MGGSGVGLPLLDLVGTYIHGLNYLALPRTDKPNAKEIFDWSFNNVNLLVDTWKVMVYVLQSAPCWSFVFEPGLLCIHK